VVLLAKKKNEQIVENTITDGAQDVKIIRVLEPEKAGERGFSGAAGD
jgi:hypothetical protein